ncbi:Pentatricopeptide repeat-containing protein [Striga hermonthica]|uniref:Pentatricopeptide repeat-containing protein n=1 Tax=Striga hermonthica TaxID=68872 RepID=A0A9N7NS15_STRHE|nr:Pentatricopeptide repeat-containing protein [Striga hermonthica]
MISRQIEILFHLSKTSLPILHRLHCLLLKTALDRHEYFFSHLLLSAASVSLPHARWLFDSSPINPPPLFAWNTLIRAYSKSSSSPSEAFRLFSGLLRAPGDVRPDNFTYPFVIKACGRCLMLGAGGSVHAMALRTGFGSDSHVNHTLVTMYGGCGAADLARRVFDEMSEKDVVSWSSMVAAYVDCKRHLDALRVFKDMVSANETPNLVTLVSLLSACTNLLDIRLGKSVHSHILINGINLHIPLGTALLNMYAKSGHLEEALRIFTSMNEKNLQSWTVMISCLADHGCGEEALSLFNKMETTGLCPDNVSFSAILSACSHNGLLRQGRELFKKMVNVYRIMPTMEHYGCMVDLLGRAGKIEDAYQIISSMSMKPNSVVLRSYLSACKQHGCVLYADKRILKLLLELEPNIGANYVLVANVTSSLGGDCDGVDKVRDYMKVKGLKKVPGYSWV